MEFSAFVSRSSGLIGSYWKDNDEVKSLRYGFHNAIACDMYVILINYSVVRGLFYVHTVKDDIPNDTKRTSLN